MSAITIDAEFKTLIPPLAPDERAQLEANIVANGCRDPLVIWGGHDVLLDGHNRYDICTRHGIPFTTVEIELEDREAAYNWIIENQLGRRNLTPEAASYLRGKRYQREKRHEGRPTKLDQNDPVIGETANRLATEYKVSAPTIKRDAQFAAAVDALTGIAGQDVRDAVLSRDAKVTRKDIVVLAHHIAPKAPELCVQVVNGAMDVSQARTEVNKRFPLVRSIPQSIPASVRLERGDARRLPLADASVDAILTSPPYGLDVPYDASTDTVDDWLSLMEGFLREGLRVGQPGCRAFVNIAVDTRKGRLKRCISAQLEQIAESVGWQYETSILWLEDNVSRSVARGSVDSARAPAVITRAEMIYVFYKDHWPRVDKTREDSDIEHGEWLDWPNGVWSFPGEMRPWEDHPAAFPEELPRRLIKLFTFPGDIVLDPFVGSGTTALVAWQLGRQAIGFDLSPEYIESAKRRLGQALREAA